MTHNFELKYIGVVAVSNEEPDQKARVETEIETLQDDRFSILKDRRYRSNYGWRRFFFDLKKGDWWENYKQSLGSYLGPWPMPLVIVILVCFYFIRKYFGAD